VLDASDAEFAAEFLMPPHRATEFARTNETDFAYCWMALAGSG